MRIQVQNVSCCKGESTDRCYCSLGGIMSLGATVEDGKYATRIK
jgi:hypothetical protein